MASNPEPQINQAIRCKKNVSNQNTGEQEQEQKDMNPYSVTYNQLQWIVIGTNTVSCPLVTCNSGNCYGVDKKCVNGVCETSAKIYTSSVYMKINNPNGSDPPQIWIWRCTYHYEWSDGTMSVSYTEDNSTSCPLGGGGGGGM